MIDHLGRKIDYLRVSITDRCNMRCRYCMPCDVPDISHDEILRYEELQYLCEIAISLGINRFKITGGEPLVRKDALRFIAHVKQLEGAASVTLTTNGYYLKPCLPQLQALHIDGVNISLDTLDDDQYAKLTRIAGCQRVQDAIRACAAAGIHTKINAVLLAETKEQILPLAALCQKYPVDVRFIELMPIGYGKDAAGMRADTAMDMIRAAYPDLRVDKNERGNGPADYFCSDSLLGHIGFIAANTHQFCQTCNRMRLTSTGLLKPCLCYDDGIDVKKILRGGSIHMDRDLRQAFSEAVRHKPSGHCFAEMDKITEHKSMNQIGG